MLTMAVESSGMNISSISESTGGSFTGRTVMLTIAVSANSPSKALYVKRSSPL